MKKDVNFQNNDEKMLVKDLSTEDAIKEYNELLELLNKEIEYLETLARKEEAILRIRIAQARRIQIEAPPPSEEETTENNKSESPQRKLKKS